MFYVDKKASAAHLGECSQIMDKIVAENPSYWPYGCNPGMFNGGIYLIRKSASHEPVGFTGWQEFQEDGKKIGYYSIGILPEYRQQGFAKEALAKLINEKSAAVDEVRALVMQHNKPSLELAKALNVNTLVKNASPLKQVLGKLLGGLAVSGGTDYMMHDGDYSHFSKMRIANALLNAGIGYQGLGSLAAGKANEGLAYLTSIPLKDLAFSGVATMPKIQELINKKIQEQQTTPSPLLSGKEKLILGGILGAGALGLTGAGTSIARSLSKAQDKRDAGRIQLRLPTRDKNDQETVVDVPLDQANLPPALVSRVMRDTRRKLREETKARTWRRDGKNRLLTNAEPYDELDEEEQVEKAAFAYYRAKLAANSNFGVVGKSMSVVNTLAPSPEEQRQKLEQQKFDQEQKKQEQPQNVAAGEDQQKVLTDLQDKQQQLVEANENLQKQMAAIQHTSDLNKEALKNISTRTSNIASNLKIAGLIKLAESAGMPNQYRTYEQFVKEDMPAMWEARQAEQKQFGEPTGFVEGLQNKAFNAFFKPDYIKQKEYESEWNKEYKKDPKFLGDYLSNLGTQAGITTAKALSTITSPFRATMRRGMYGLRQFGEAASAPMEQGEAWYNPSMARVKALLGGAGNTTSGFGLSAAQLGSGSVGKLLTGGSSAFLEPSQIQGGPIQYLPDQQLQTTQRAQTGFSPEEQSAMRQRLSSEPSVINYLNRLPYYGYSRSSPQEQFYQSLGMEQQPLGLIQQGLLSAAGGSGGNNMVRSLLSGLTGGLFFNSPASSGDVVPGVTQADVQTMRTPVQPTR